MLIDQAQDKGTLSLERANLYRVYVLTGDDRLPAAYESDTPADATFLARRLQREFGLMEPGAARQTVSATLRPATPSAASRCFSSATVLPDTRETDHFAIQYREALLNALPEPLPIDAFADSLETAWRTEVDQFRWAAPPKTAAAEQDLGGKYHVRIDPTLGPGDADATCMLLNGDFSQFPGTARGALDATTAHEFNHSLQFGYGALSGDNEPELNFSEGGATWMEDEVQDGSNDNYNYLYPEFTSSMGEHGGNEYAYWLTFRGLTERFGTNVAGGGEDVMQEFWELTSRNAADSLTAMQGALATKAISLATAYHDYAITAKFNAACGGGFALPLCFEEGRAYVEHDDEGNREPNGETEPQGSIASPGESHAGIVEDNYALNWVSLPSAGSYDVTVRNTSPGGSLRVTLACNTGAGIALAPLAVTLPAGTESRVSGFNPAGAACQETVAVITNDSQTAPDPDESEGRGYIVATAAAPAATTPAVPVAGSGSTAGSAGTAVVPAPPSPPATTTARARASRLVFGRVISRRNGVVLIRARVSGAGILKATAGRRVRASLLSRRKRLTVARRTVRPKRAGLITLRLKAGRKARRVIRRSKRRLRARTTLVFTPATGDRRIKAKTVTFRLKR